MATLSDIFPENLETYTGDLQLIRLSETPSLIVLFTQQIEQIGTHYVYYRNLMGEFRCNASPGHRCILCDIAIPLIHRAILPAYDLVADGVGVLLISSSSHPFALGPQVVAELRRGGLAERILMITRSRNKFEVKSLPAKPGQDMGEAQIKTFQEALAGGRISLANAIPSRGNAELLDVPEIERAATALGLTRSDYAEVTGAGAMAP
jgi:hypothetical protein